MKNHFYRVGNIFFNPDFQVNIAIEKKELDIIVECVGGFENFSVFV